MTSPFVRRRRLGAELRALREQRGLTADDVARVLCYSRMKISRIENGHNRPNLVEIMKILDYLEVTGEKYQQLVQIAREGAERGWWDEYGDAMGRRQRMYADIESDAKTIREYNQFTIPGLLQTPDFIRCMIELAKAEGKINFHPEHMLNARLHRQSHVLGPKGPRYEVIIDEVVIRRPSVPPQVMSDQLQSLIEKALKHPRVTIHILPVQVDFAPRQLPKSAFSLYTFPDPDDPPIAVDDTMISDVVHIDQREVMRYTQGYEHLLQVSLSGAATISLLTEAAEDLKKKIGLSA